MYILAVPIIANKYFIKLFCSCNLCDNCYKNFRLFRQLFKNVLNSLQP